MGAGSWIWGRYPFFSCPALGQDSSVLESGPRDFKARYLGRDSSPSLSHGGEGKEGARGEYPQDCLGELPAGEGGTEEPWEGPLGRAGSSDSPSRLSFQSL